MARKIRMYDLKRSRRNSWLQTYHYSRDFVHRWFRLRFKRSPDYPAEKHYFNEWLDRFASGQVERYMDSESLAALQKLKANPKMKIPMYKGIGGTAVKIVQTYP